MTTQSLGFDLDHLSTDPDPQTDGPDWAKAIREAIIRAEKVLALSPLKYGGVGDGVTDDTEALQNCIQDAIDDGGGTILLPRGFTWYCDTELGSFATAYGVRIVGEGAGNGIVASRIVYGGDHHRTFSDGAITSGSAALSSAGSTAAFTQKDVGTKVSIPGAGTGGDPLVTAIVAVTDAGHATLRNVADVTVSGATVTVGLPFLAFPASQGCSFERFVVEYTNEDFIGDVFNFASVISDGYSGDITFDRVSIGGRDGANSAANLVNLGKALQTEIRGPANWFSADYGLRGLNEQGEIRSIRFTDFKLGAIVNLSRSWKVTVCTATGLRDPDTGNNGQAGFYSYDVVDNARGITFDTVWCGDNPVAGGVWYKLAGRAFKFNNCLAAGLCDYAMFLYGPGCTVRISGGEMGGQTAMAGTNTTGGALLGLSGDSTVSSSAILDNAQNIPNRHFMGRFAATGTQVIAGDTSIELWAGVTGSSQKAFEIQAAKKVGFAGATPQTFPMSVTGSRGGNAALASLLTKLASAGIITDSTSA